jgi:hypothetical protein
LGDVMEWQATVKKRIPKRPLHSPLPSGKRDREGEPGSGRYCRPLFTKGCLPPGADEVPSFFNRSAFHDVHQFDKWGGPIK